MNILRPLSPHLPIYKPQLTSTFPIFRRSVFSFLLLAIVFIFVYSIILMMGLMVLFFYLLCLKIGLICFTYANFYQFLFYSSKLILGSISFMPYWKRLGSLWAYPLL
uniref:Succinate dehydrogenase subunit 3 n=1 Tax=Camellia sinensis var. assamica TaxID=261999 RepID=A0A517LRL6_CAMSB|nr:succinate dehydrogenase subunit 3 [Camellia sinensis var. assamica]